MSNQRPITIVVANRPRLFRELLHHALKTLSSTFHVVEAPEATPTPSLLRFADWLIVDEESATDVAKWTVNNPQLGIVALSGRGNSARLLTSARGGVSESFFSAPSLSELLNLLSQPAVETAR